MIIETNNITLNTEDELNKIHKFWSSLITDNEAPLTNRVKASELLYKSLSVNDIDSENPTETISLDKKIKLIKQFMSKEIDFNIDDD